MDNASPHSASLVFFSPFGIESGPGFALPIFQKSNSLYIQNVDEFSNKVLGFDALQQAPAIRKVSVSRECHIGDSPLYIFLDEKGGIHVGNSIELGGELRRVYSAYPPRPFLNLQIAELIGSDGMREAARIAVYRAVAHTTGYSAANSLLRATIRQAFWGALIQSAADDASAEKLTRHRREIISNSDPDKPELLSPKLWDQITPLLGIPPQEIIDRVSGTRSIKNSDTFGDLIKIYTLNEHVGFDIVEGSTPLDVAYLIHTKLGDQTVGAKINGVVKPLRTRLVDGDRIQILKSRAQEPQRNWLDFVGTDYAYTQIVRSLKRKKLNRSSPQNPHGGKVHP